MKDVITGKDLETLINLQSVREDELKVAILLEWNDTSDVETQLVILEDPTDVLSNGVSSHEDLLVLKGSWDGHLSLKRQVSLRLVDKVPIRVLCCDTEASLRVLIHRVSEIVDLDNDFFSIRNYPRSSIFHGERATRCVELCAQDFETFASMGDEGAFRILATQ